ILPYGNGRSYGDSCLNPGGALLLTRSMDRFIAFDRDAGLITCEAGVLLADILQLTGPAGWFLAVVPGTSAVTVGGAIANDVHGRVVRLLVSRKKSGTGSAPASQSFGKSGGAPKAPYGPSGRAVRAAVLSRQHRDAAALQFLVLSSPGYQATPPRAISEFLLSAGQRG